MKQQSQCTQASFICLVPQDIRNDSPLHQNWSEKLKNMVKAKMNKPGNPDDDPAAKYKLPPLVIPSNLGSDDILHRLSSASSEFEAIQTNENYTIASGVCAPRRHDGTITPCTTQLPKHARSIEWNDTDEMLAPSSQSSTLAAHRFKRSSKSHNLSLESNSAGVNRGSCSVFLLSKLNE